MALNVEALTQQKKNLYTTELTYPCIFMLKQAVRKPTSESQSFSAKYARLHNLPLDLVPYLLVPTGAGGAEFALFAVTFWPGVGTDDVAGDVNCAWNAATQG